MKCEYCQEEILPGELSHCTGSDLHQECLFRMVSGSVRHIRRECSCFGGDQDTDGDEPGLTLRQGAAASLSEWRAQAGHHAPSERMQ